MRKSLCIASLSLGVFASGAYAADVAIQGSLSQTLEASDNYFLQNSPIGSTFKSLSAVNLDILARTPGWRYLLSSHVSYYTYFGEGADAANPTSGTPINETFRVDHVTDDTKYFFTANYNRADVAATQLRETGNVTGSGTINTFRASGGLTYDINRIDSISWAVLANRTTFTNDPTQPDITDVSSNVAWTRLLDPATSWTTSLNFDWLDADDIARSQRLFWQILTGVHSQLTRRLTITANIGAAFANAWQDNPMPFATTSFIRTGAASSVVATAVANYQLLRTTNLTVSAAHLIVPTTFGQLQKTSTAAFIISHDINYWSNIAFLANFAQTESNSGNLVSQTSTADFFSLGVGYSYKLARDWQARLSYTFRQRHDDTGTANANVVLMSLVYNFNLMGNPNAFDPIETERALLRQQRAIGEVFPTLQ